MVIIKFDMICMTINDFLEWHIAVGMGLLVQVGETHDMMKPPENFPKCNSFKPSINEEFLNTLS